jgi:hypothetical protein
MGVTLPLARNAEPILAARRRGLKPDQMVMVSLVDRIETSNIVVFADPGTEYDWRWVRGLDIAVWIGDEPTWAPTVLAIARQWPDYLCIWHQGQGWGARVYLVPTEEDLARPVRFRVGRLDFLEWMAFQNRDFIEGRTYQPTSESRKHEPHSRQHGLQRLHGGAGAVPHHSGGGLP